MRFGTHTFRRLASLTPALAVAALMTLAAPPPAHAQIGSWLNPVDGLFQDSANWSGGVIPGLTDEARFGVNPGGPFTVIFNADVANQHLLIFNQQQPVFDLGGFVYTVTNLMGVAPNGGTGDLTITNGALNTGYLRISDNGPGSVGSLVITGPATSFTKLGGSNDSNVGNFPGNTGSLSVTDGASATFNGHNLFIGREGGVGTLTIETGGSLTKANGHFFIGAGVSGATSAVGTVTVTGAGSTLDAQLSLLVGQGGGTGHLTVLDAQITVGSNLNVGDNVYSNGQPGMGTMTVTGSNAVVTSSGTMHIGISNGNGSVSASNGASISVLNGMFVGDGGVGALTLDALGTVSADHYSQGAAGTLRVQLSPSGAGQLQVAGNASFSGTLDITLADGFSPSLGDSFDIVTYGSHTGQFDTITGLNFLNNGMFDVQYGANAVTVTVTNASVPLFVPRGDFPLVNFGAASIAMGDLNSDGVLDLAVTHDLSNGDNLSILLGVGDGTFSSLQSFATGTNAVSVALGDLNTDGALDIAVANFGEPFASPPIPGNVSILIGEGDGTFAPQQTFPVGDAPRSLAIGDLDGDGFLDLAVANSLSDNVSILLGNGSGGFAPQQDFPTGHGPFSVTIGDVDADGRLDLAVANKFSGNISILLGAGDGTFVTQQTIFIGGGAYFISMGDLDGDGNHDIVVTSNSAGNVSILHGAGDGSFTNLQVIPVGTDPRSVTIGDLNADGASDLVIANYGAPQDSPPIAGGVSVLLGIGDGTFTPPQTFPVFDVPIYAAIGDLDGDDDLDLAVVDFSHLVSILLNTTASANAPGVVDVPAMANIFGAGRVAPPDPAGGGAGVAPPYVTVSPRGVGFVQILSAEGTVSAVAGCENGPNGGVCYAGDNTDILSTHGVSGVIHEFRTMFLCGVFVGPAEPMDPAPPRLNVTDADFVVDSHPMLNQTFFIGNGMTTSGEAQRFFVPAGATRLHFGFADSFLFGNPTSPPGFYSDNIGALTIEVFRTSILSTAVDFNNDGFVNGADLAQVLTNWGPCLQNSSCSTDLNGDGIVNGADLAQLLTNWGPVQ